MAKLDFEIIKNLSEEMSNVRPRKVDMLKIGNEPNNDIWQYFIYNDCTWSNQSHIDHASYNQLEWTRLSQSMTSQRVSRIGVKTFPQIGAIGFFKLYNEERSKILAPIHVPVKKYSAPLLTYEETEDSLIFLIIDPVVPPILDDGEESEEIKYTCYRIILRLDYFALEYVTYEHRLQIPKPPTTGTYDIYCVGYAREGAVVSADSDHYTRYIKGIQEHWPIPAPDTDTYITSIDADEKGNLIATRNDEARLVSHNQVVMSDIYATNVTIDPEGYLLVTLSNDTVIKSSNIIPIGDINAVLDGISGEVI